MDLFIVPILAITGERLLVVVSALTSIVIGWRLFAMAIIPRQSGTISIGDWKVELKTVGPGVFFSLFGTIVLTFVLVHPAEYNITRDKETNIPSSFSGKGLAPTQNTESRSYVRAINTIIQIKKQIAIQQETPNSTATLLPAQRKDLVAAAYILSQQRRKILLSKFSARLIDEWENNENTYRSSRRQLTDDTLERLDKIAPWFTQNVTDEGVGIP